MNGGNHLLIGGGSAALALWGLHAAGAAADPVTVAIGVGIAGLGALMPDIDYPYSLASRTLPKKLAKEALNLLIPVALFVAFFAAFGGRAVGEKMFASFASWLRFGMVMAVIAAGFFALSLLVRRLTTHRGATHSLAFAAAATVVGCISSVLLSGPWWYGILFGWGWLTHLAADATTSMGLPSLLWPFDTVSATPAPEVNWPQRVPVEPAVDLARPGPAPVAAAAPDEASLCPSCGAPMVLRVAKRGQHTGQRFYGCTNFPRCRQTRKPN